MVTCTPYGVNTHRMLVRGVRVENVEVSIEVPADAEKLPNYLVVPAVAIPMLFVLLVILMIVYRRKPTTVTLEDIHTVSRAREQDSDSEE